MVTARVTSKGQVTIPKEVRERLGVRAGEDIGFEERGGLFVVSKVVPESPFDKWVGKLKHLKGRRSDDLVREARGHGHSR
jgi:antitoxin PrlF